MQETTQSVGALMDEASHQHQSSVFSSTHGTDIKVILSSDSEASDDHTTFAWYCSDTGDKRPSCTSNRGGKMPSYPRCVHMHTNITAALNQRTHCTAKAHITSPQPLSSSCM